MEEWSLTLIQVSWQASQSFFHSSGHFGLFLVRTGVGARRPAFTREPPPSPQATQHKESPSSYICGSSQLRLMK